jgi:hypothetical protein
MFLRESGNWQLKERARLASELQILLHECLMESWRETITQEQYKKIIEKVFDRKLSPLHAVEKLIKR